MNQLPTAFWSLSVADLFKLLDSVKEGLTGSEAKKRLELYGANLLKPQKRSDVLTLMLSQFKSPIILILFVATGLSFFLHDPVDAIIILSIVLVSGLLGFWQERGASNAIEKLLSIVQIKATVLRDGKSIEIPVEQIVPGDIVILNAGDIIPGDGLVQNDASEGDQGGADENVLGHLLHSREDPAGHLPGDPRPIAGWRQTLDSRHSGGAAQVLR